MFDFRSYFTVIGPGHAVAFRAGDVSDCAHPCIALVVVRECAARGIALHCEASHVLGGFFETPRRCL